MDGEPLRLEGYEYDVIDQVSQHIDDGGANDQARSYLIRRAAHGEGSADGDTRAIVDEAGLGVPLNHSVRPRFLWTSKAVPRVGR